MATINKEGTTEPPDPREGKSDTTQSVGLNSTPYETEIVIGNQIVNEMRDEHELNNPTYR